MKPLLAEPIKIITPKKFILDGLWFGPTYAKRVIIYVHGLSANAFYNHELVVPLVDKQTAVFTFSNRGHDIIASLHHLRPGSKKGYKSFLAGVAHEVFKDCVDDLAGVVKMARARGARSVFFIGHSTGCQKSIYYLSRHQNQPLVKGVVLLCPISDYASLSVDVSRGHYLRAIKEAKVMVKRKQGDHLLPKKLWPRVLDAQRFLSLYSPNSPEEIFSYTQPAKRPTTFKKVKLPMLVVLAEQDQCSDISADILEEWFRKQTSSINYMAAIIPNANHSFYKQTKPLNLVLKNWLIQQKA